MISWRVPSPEPRTTVIGWSWNWEINDGACSGDVVWMVWSTDILCASRSGRTWSLKKDGADLSPHAGFIRTMRVMARFYDVVTLLHLIILVPSRFLHLSASHPHSSRHSSIASPVCSLSHHCLSTTQSCQAWKTHHWQYPQNTCISHINNSLLSAYKISISPMSQSHH